MAINPLNSIAVVQPGGAGRPIKWLPAETDVDAISGGDISYEYDWAGTQYIGARRTSNPGAWTGTINSRRLVVSELRRLAEQICLFNFLLAYGCPPQTLTEFDFLEVYVDAGVTSLGASDQISTRTTGTDPRLMDNLGISAGVRVELRPLGQSNISGTTIVSGINDIVPVASARCASVCGGYLDGTEEWIAVTDGIAPGTVPQLLHTDDGGNTWTVIPIAAVTNAVANGVAIAGDKVLVACSGTTGGIYTAPLKDIRAGSASFTLAAGTLAANAFNAIAANNMDAIAVGNAGLISVSRDGGYSWTVLSSGTASALNDVSMNDGSLAVAVGASGTVVRVDHLARVTLFNPSALTGLALTAVAIPPNRPNEAYVGTQTGGIFKTDNINYSTPTWSELGFDKPSGGSSINAIGFGGPNGVTFWVLQENGTAQTRVLVDYSGGAMGAYVRAITPFASSIGASGNAIGVASGNYAMWVGEADVSTYGTIARVAAAV